MAVVFLVAGCARATLMHSVEGEFTAWKVPQSGWLSRCRLRETNLQQNARLLLRFSIMLRCAGRSRYDAAPVSRKPMHAANPQ
jgi:hypothetical protein